MTRIVVLVVAIGSFLAHLSAVNRAAIGHGSGPLFLTVPLAIGSLSVAARLWFGGQGRDLP